MNAIADACACEPEEANCSQGEHSCTAAKVADLERHHDQLTEMVCKWGRMQNALLALLARKGVTSKDDVMAEVYARLGVADDLDGAEGPGSDAVVANARREA